MPNDDGATGHLVSPPVLAGLIGVTAQTLRDWGKKHGFPSAAYRRQYDLGEVLRWFREVWQDVDREVAEEEVARRTKRADMRIKEGKASIVEMEEGLKSGELLRKADVEARQVAKVRAVRESWRDLVEIIKAMYNRTHIEIAEEVETYLQRVADRFASGDE